MERAGVDKNKNGVVAASEIRQRLAESRSLDRAARREGNATGIESSRAPSSSLYLPKKVVPIEAPRAPARFSARTPAMKNRRRAPPDALAS